MERPSRRARVALGAAGAVLLGAVLVGADLSSPFGGGEPVPALPDAGAGMEAAHAQVVDAGGARWTGSVHVRGREVATYTGKVSHTKEGCSTHIQETLVEEDGARPGTESVVTPEQAAVRHGEGEWSQQLLRAYAPTLPTFLAVYAPNGACTVALDLARGAETFPATTDVAGLPPLAERGSRYAGVPTLGRLEDLHRATAHRAHRELLGRNPTRAELEMAEPALGAVAEKAGHAVVDVDGDGAPKKMWYTSKEAGDFLVELTYEELGPQEITLPSKVLPDPDEEAIHEQYPELVEER